MLWIFKSFKFKRDIINEIDESILLPIIDKYKFFFNYINNEKMLHIDEMKPLFNGQEIIKMLNIKPGKEIGKLLELLIEEQIKDPNFSKESAIEFLNKKKEEICINQNNNTNGTINKKKKKKGK